MSVSEWTPEQVVEWLKGLPVPISSDVSTAFLSGCVDGGYLLQLDHAKLLDLKVTALGHREVILGCVSKLSSMFRDHHSERCHGLAQEVISMCAEVKAFLEHLSSLTSGTGDAGGYEQPSTMGHCNVGSLLCDLLRSSRNLAIWLDMNRVQDYTKDYPDYRQVLLRTSLFLATKFQDPDTPHADLIEKCTVLSTLASSLKECLNQTDLGNIRPVKSMVTLAPANSNPRGWGFSIKAIQGSIFINSILPETPAATCGDLHSRDELIEVNGSAITSWVFENVTSRLRLACKTEPLPLTVLRGVVPTAAASRSNVISPSTAARPHFKLLPDSLKTLALGARDSAPAAFKTPSLIDVSGGDSGRGSAATGVAGKLPALFDALNKDADRDDEGSSDGSSEDEDEMDEDEIVEIKTAERTSTNSRNGGVKTSQSEMVMPSYKPHPSLERNNSSLPAMAPHGTESAGMEFGYRTQVVGGVVMRIPVSGPGDALPKSKTSRKHSRSMLQFFARKSSSLSSQDQAGNSFKGFGSADMKSSSSTSSTKPSKREADSTVSNGESSRTRQPLQRVNSDHASVTSHQLLKKRSSHTSAGRAASISRIFDKETNIGDCNIPVSALKNPECQGWMTKKGNVKRNWKRRWFVLKNLCLYYYRTPQDDTALNVIPLPSYDVDLATDSKKSFSLRLAHKNARTFHMYCDTFEDMVMWMEALKAASSGCVTIPTRPPTAASETGVSDPQKSSSEFEITESTRC